MTDKPIASYLIAIAALWLLAMSTSVMPVPTLITPYCLTVAMPVLLLQSFGVTYPARLFIGSSLVPIIFAAWSLPVAWRQERIPIRTKVLATIIVLLSVVHLIMSWSYGVTYQGRVHTIGMYALNLIFGCLLLVLYRRNVHANSYPTNYLFPWLTFAYLAWIAFPWLGELP
jgi:hypothetical protein